MSNLYNPHSNYQLFMVPGILAVLLTMVGGFLAALNIVKEKEISTIEQLNVSPIKKYQFILGKMVPFWLLGFIILTIGLVVSYVVHGIAPGQNIGLIYLFSGVCIPVFFGPKFKKFNEAVLMIDLEIAFEVDEPEVCSRCINALESDEIKYKAIKNKSIRFFDENRGATEKIASELYPYLT